MIAGLQRTFSSLAVYNYRLYWFGQLVSVSGTWMQTIAQSWLVLQLTNSPVALGTVTMLPFLPVTLLTLFGGVLADRRLAGGRTRRRPGRPADRDGHGGALRAGRRRGGLARAPRRLSGHG